MSSDPMRDTIRVYDEGASEFVARNCHIALPEQFEALEAHLPRGGLVIDVGAGPGWHSLEWKRRGRRAIPLDLSAGMLAEARTLGARDCVRADMRQLPLASGCADGLWVSASLLHVPRADAPATLREFARVLKSGGAMYLGVKGGTGERFTYPLKDAARYFVFWGEEELDDALRAAGFEVVKGWTSMPEAKATRADPWLNRVAVKPA